MRKLKMEGSDGATELTLKIVCDGCILLQCLTGANYCLKKEVESLWDLEKELSRVGMEYCWSLTLQTTALFEAPTESISTWLGRIRNMMSEG